MAVGRGLNLPLLATSPYGSINPPIPVTRGLKYLYAHGSRASEPYELNRVTGLVDAVLTGNRVLGGSDNFGIQLGLTGYIDTPTLEATPSFTLFGVANVAAAHALQSTINGNITSTNGINVGWRATDGRLQLVWSDDDASNDIKTVGYNFGLAAPAQFYAAVVDTAALKSTLYLPGLIEAGIVVGSNNPRVDDMTGARVVTNAPIRLGARRDLHTDYGTPAIHYMDGYADVAWTGAEVGTMWQAWRDWLRPAGIL